MNEIIKKKNIKFSQIIIVAVLLFATAIVVLPLLILIWTSLKEPGEFMLNPAGLPHKLYLKNYAYVFIKGGTSRAMAVSLFVTILSISGMLFTGSLVSYALTKMSFKKEKQFSMLFLIPMIFPAQSFILPIYFGYQRLHLTNNLLGLVGIYVAGGLPMVILILTGFMKTVPIAVSESAYVEGASHFKIYSSIILPLVKPAFSTAIVISGLNVWNDFFTPLIFITNKKLATLPLAVYIFRSGFSSDWGKIATCLVFLVIPIVVVYVFLQRYIISGVVAGSVKG